MGSYTIFFIENIVLTGATFDIPLILLKIWLKHNLIVDEILFYPTIFDSISIPRRVYRINKRKLI